MKLPKHDKRSEQDAAHAFAVTYKQLFQGPVLRLDEVKKVYEELFNDRTFTNLTGPLRPHFNTHLYPPLSETLLSKEPPTDLPAWRTPAQLLERAVNDSPLAQVLAAYIWKRGELDRVKHVTAGLTSMPEERLHPDSSTDAAVMWQFGRHLRHPALTPIFDQHTYRAFRRLQALGGNGAQPPAVRRDTRGAVPGRDHLNAYLEWWRAAVFDRIDKVDSRPETLYRMDMLLFSLGKAAPRMPDPPQAVSRRRRPQKA
jgi:hypothetical protein